MHPKSGVFPEGFPIPRGFGDLLRQEGNQTTKYNASLRWRRDMFGAGFSAYYLSDFVETGAGHQARPEVGDPVHDHLQQLLRLLR